MRPETRLHRARMARGMELTDLLARTCLSPGVLQKIDEGRFAELPAGVYARSYVRAFASAVGLEPTQIIQELDPVLPTISDPIDGLREVVRQSEATSAGAKILRARLGAALIDAAVLLLMDATVVQVIAFACLVDVTTLLEQVGGIIAMFCAIPVALYFVVFSGVGGRTPGAWLWKLPPSPWIVVRGSTLS